MAEARTRKANDWAYYREADRYKKAIAHWQNFQICGGLTIAAGAVLVAVAVNEYTRLDLTGMVSLALIGLAVAVLGLIPWLIGRNKIAELEYKAAAHDKTLRYLKALGVTDSAQVLEDNPVFRKIFRNVKTASIAAYIANPPSLTGLRSVNTLARQLKVLLDRNENTRELKALLFSLVSDRGANTHQPGDYKSLAEFLITEFWIEFKSDLMIARQEYFFKR